jgi:hypothetical protein
VGNGIWNIPIVIRDVVFVCVLFTFRAFCGVGQEIKMGFFITGAICLLLGYYLGYWYRGQFERERVEKLAESFIRSGNLARNVRMSIMEESVIRDFASFLALVWK